MNEAPTEQDEHDDDTSFLDKVEEATGGMHKPAPRAGFQEDGNLEGIQDGQQSESR
jgi:hypothetical protein